jgi:probable rRNA maturation factor
MTDAGEASPPLQDADLPEEDEPPERLTLEVVREGGDWSSVAAPEQAVRDAAALLARHPRCRRARGAQASIVLAGDALVRRLNATYRGKDTATNVLSFPFQPPPGADAGSYLGDVVLGAETVAREAAERGIAPVSHFQHLVVHGVLHLLGFDHEGDAEAEDMQAIEIEIFAALGIADPYAAARS